MAKPRVSILIDTYNHEKFIEKAVRSVLEQDISLDDAEILVVDDGSTDRTLEILKTFEPRIRILRKTNGGQASAFNFAIPQCSGEIVALLDGDDWWAKDKLRHVLAAFESYPSVGAVGHGCLMVDAEGNLQKILVPKESVCLNVRTLENARKFTKYMCFFGTSKVAYRKFVLDRILPIPEGARIEADEFLFTLAPFFADALVLNRPLFYYRLHSANLYMQTRPTEAGSRRMYDSLACLVRHLTYQLQALGAPPEIDECVLAPLRLQTKRMRLQLEGGSRWEMFELERATNLLAYRNSSFGYRIFKNVALLMSLLFSPQQFLRLRQWYSTMGLTKVRSYIGNPPPVVHIDERHFREDERAFSKHR